MFPIISHALTRHQSVRHIGKLWVLKGDAAFDNIIGHQNFVPAPFDRVFTAGLHSGELTTYNFTERVAEIAEKLCATKEPFDFVPAIRVAMQQLMVYSVYGIDDNINLTSIYGELLLQDGRFTAALASSAIGGAHSWAGRVMERVSKTGLPKAKQVDPRLLRAITHADIAASAITSLMCVLSGTKAPRQFLGEMNESGAKWDRVFDTVTMGFPPVWFTARVAASETTVNLDGRPHLFHPGDLAILISEDSAHSERGFPDAQSRALVASIARVVLVEFNRRFRLARAPGFLSAPKAGRPLWPGNAVFRVVPHS